MVSQLLTSTAAGERSYLLTGNDFGMERQREIRMKAESYTEVSGAYAKDSRNPLWNMDFAEEQISDGATNIPLKEGSAQVLVFQEIAGRDGSQRSASKEKGKICLSRSLDL